MGHDAKPTKYQIQLEVAGAAIMPMSWNCRRDGRPTADNLTRYVKGWEASTLPGGVNDHLGIETVIRARVMLNDGSRTVKCSYERAPMTGVMFETITYHNV